VRLATPDEKADVAATKNACGAELEEGCWLGAVRDGDNFAWETGEPFVYPYFEPPWAENEPNDFGGDEDCLEVLAPQPTDRPLNDDWCDDDQYAVCEIVPAPSP
jgi:hypothetical protein